MLAGAAVIGLLLLYPQIWAISPSSDDYGPPMAELHRGIAQGPWAFFVEPSSYPFYRPLTFLAYWLAGTVSMEHITAIVHGLHFFWTAACVAILALWARALNFSRAALAVSALVFVTHPLLAGPLASIDGFQRIASTAWTWLGAWFVVRSARGSFGSDLAAAACLALGLGFAEYALGLVPLALLAALWRRHAGRSWASIVRLAVLLGGVAVVWYGIRKGVLGPQSSAFVDLQPLSWPANVGQLVAVALFWGNTVWSMLGPQPWADLVTALAIALALAWLIAGLALAEPAWPSGIRALLARLDVGLLVPAMLVATFPMAILNDISEMYAMPVLMAVALVAGRSADGWLSASRGWRRPAFAAAAAAIVIGISASWAKIDGVAAAGRRSDEQVRQILSHIPPQAPVWRIATLFDPAEPEPSYSVFRPWSTDREVVRPFTLVWFRPAQDLRLERLTLPEACARVDEPFDVVLKWDRATARYQALEAGLAAACKGGDAR